jgi:hypothetical protein
LKVLKNKPKLALATGKKSSDVQVLNKVPGEKTVTHASFQKQKEEPDRYKVPDRYEHGKPFCYWWQLSEGSSELMRLHGWIMHEARHSHFHRKCPNMVVQ